MITIDVSLYAKEFPVYGQSRLGLVNLKSSDGSPGLLSNLRHVVEMNMGEYAVSAINYDPELTSDILHHVDFGNKTYEISDYLGNITTTFSDKVMYASGNLKTDRISSNDYYPFGSAMPGRQFSSGENYRYGFTGLEKDDEVAGDGNHLSFGDYGYSPRIGRRWNVDPKFHEIPGLSPYVYSLNNPLVYKDPEGELPILPFLLKAGAAGTADMLAQAAMAYYFDPNVESSEQALSMVNKWQVARSAAEGLIPWKTPGGRIGRAAATASGDVVVNAINADSYSQEQALQDFATGFIGDLAGGGLGELTAKYGSKAMAKGLSKMGFEYGDVNKMLGGGVKQINRTVGDVTATRKMVGWADGKVAVIGRGQKNRVNKFAEGIGGAETWGEFNPDLSDAENLANNKAWIQGLKDDGYTIYDVGTGPKSSDKGASTEWRPKKCLEMIKE